MGVKYVFVFLSVSFPLSVSAHLIKTCSPILTANVLDLLLRVKPQHKRSTCDILGAIFCVVHTFLTTFERYGSRRGPRLRYLHAGDDVDAPAVAGRRPALLREEVPEDVALRHVHADETLELVATELAEAHVLGDGGGGVDGGGFAQGQNGAEGQRHHGGGVERRHGGGVERHRGGGVEVCQSQQQRTQTDQL